MNKSESIAKLADALAKFQAEVQDPAKNSDNPFFKSKYVELDDLLKATRPVLSKHGLAIMQEPTSSDGQLISIKTIILHSSGEWIEFEPLTLKVVKVDPQGAGSAITYGRRYTLSSVLGVAWDADDDANQASGKQSQSTYTQQNKQTNTNTPAHQQKPATSQTSESDAISAPQLQKLQILAKEQGLSSEDMRGIINFKYKVDSSKKLTKTQASYMIENLDKLWTGYIAEQNNNEKAVTE